MALRLQQGDGFEPDGLYTGKEEGVVAIEHIIFGHEEGAAGIILTNSVIGGITQLL